LTFPRRIAIASRNPGKIREILAICSDWPVEWATADQRLQAWPEVDETGLTYLENALLKAEAVSRALDVPAIADDSGIEVDALGGAPGVHSARFAGPAASDADNLRKLIASIERTPEPERTARYRCVAVLARGIETPVWAEATCRGTLLTEPRGTGGFGYDPIFVPEGETRTMAELTPEEKDRISHRGKAFRALRLAIEERR
jgi:XTP/dITP diphosphohydrolase